MTNGENGMQFGGILSNLMSNFKFGQNLNFGASQTGECSGVQAMVSNVRANIINTLSNIHTTIYTTRRQMGQTQYLAQAHQSVASIRVFPPCEIPTGEGGNSQQSASVGGTVTGGTGGASI